MALEFLKKLGKAFGGAASPDAPLTWEQERSRFFTAIKTCDTAVMEETVAKYPDALEWRNKSGEKPLYIALEKNNFASFNKLLELGAPIGQQELTPYGDKLTILHFAGRKGRADFVERLLELGADTGTNGGYYTADAYATQDDKNYDLADRIRRAPAIRAAYLAAHPEEAPPPAAPETETVEAGADVKPLKTVKFEPKAKQPDAP